eukprot:scaffold173895_cov20-Tisochrysis_lutea.AAC.1
MPQHCDVLEKGKSIEMHVLTCVTAPCHRNVMHLVLERVVRLCIVTSSIAERYSRPACISAVGISKCIPVLLSVPHACITAEAGRCPRIIWKMFKKALSVVRSSLVREAFLNARSRTWLT